VTALGMLAVATLGGLCWVTMQFAIWVAHKINERKDG
jgi:hypothetical protein